MNAPGRSLVVWIDNPQWMGPDRGRAAARAPPRALRATSVSIRRTPGVSRCRKRERRRSGHWRQSAGCPGWVRYGHGTPTLDLTSAHFDLTAPWHVTCAPIRVLDFLLRARGRCAGEHPDGTD